MDADIIVAGAGCAGLSFAVQALALHPEAAVTLIQPAREAPPKLWSYWEDASAIDQPFPEVPRRVWDRMRVSFPGWSAVQSLDPLRYATIRSEDYYAVLHRALARHRHVRWVRGSVQAIDNRRHHAEVTVDGAVLRAPYVFQSALPCPADRGATARYPMRQRFEGWVVRTPEPQFDATHVTWMDFDVEQRDPLNFVYVLPFSPNEALFELTAFTFPDRAMADDAAPLKRLLDRTIDGPYQVVRREASVLPMDDRRWSPRWGSRVFNLGSVAGMLKPSTGYAFARIQRQAEHLARTWAAGHPEPFPGPAWRHRLYDVMLLRLLHERPREARSTYEALLRNWSFREMLGFLDERTDFAQEIALMRKVPPGPFVRSLPAALLAF